MLVDVDVMPSSAVTAGVVVASTVVPEVVSALWTTGASSPHTCAPH